MVTAKLKWDKYGYTIASEYRKKVVAVLKQKPRSPKQIADQTTLHLSHVSSTLSDLEEKGIVQCLTPNLRKGKIFSLTEIGKEIAEELSKRMED